MPRPILCLIALLDRSPAMPQGEGLITGFPRASVQPARVWDIGKTPQARGVI